MRSWSGDLFPIEELNFTLGAMGDVASVSIKGDSTPLERAGARKLPGFAVTVEIARHQGLKRFGRDAKATESALFGHAARR